MFLCRYDVRLLVRGQLTGSVVLLVANLTLVILLPGVSEDVMTALAGRGERFRTNVTFVRLFTRVQPHVILEMSTMIVLRPTNLAGETLVPCMYELMISETRLTREHLATSWAFHSI